MTPELKDAIFTFLRAIVAAGIATAVVFIAGVDLLHTDPVVLGKGILDAFLTGALLFLGAWARNFTTQSVPVPAQRARGARAKKLAGPHLSRTRSWADLLPV